MQEEWAWKGRTGAAWSGQSSEGSMLERRGMWRSRTIDIQGMRETRVQRGEVPVSSSHRSEMAEQGLESQRPLVTQTWMFFSALIKDIVGWIRHFQPDTNTESGSVNWQYPPDLLPISRAGRGKNPKHPPKLGLQPISIGKRTMEQFQMPETIEASSAKTAI